MKSVSWMANTLETVKGYSANVKKEIGYNLDKIQRGQEPFDWKPMNTVGRGVREIRIHDDAEYRVLYVAKFSESVYMLHAFVKKTLQTPQKDIDLAKKRYTEMLKIREMQT